MSPTIKKVACLAVCLLFAQAHAQIDPKPEALLFWDNAPAKDWQSQAYPLGNGRLGCMVFGGVENEHIQFNEDSLWLGSESDTGSYQNFGDIHIDLNTPEATNYSRELDISRAVQTITYSSNGTNYRREYFSSAPAQVMVFRFTADKKAAHTGRISLVDAHGAPLKIEGNRITASGDTDGKWDKRVKGGNIVLNYESQVWVLNEGGSLQAREDGFEFKDCDSLTILVAAGTDFLNQRVKGWKQDHPHQRVTDSLTRASRQSFDELLQAHIKDYQSLFNRLTIELGDSPEELRALPMSERLARYKKSADPDLEELLFQHARYLMISSSRPGGLPANLQGIWNNSNNPPWRCDFHSNVNLQMNYWFVDQANLSQCFKPLAEWFYSIREVRREETKAHFGKRGIAMHVENGIFGGSTWKWSIGDASWLANNLWSHYEFTRDGEYLKTRAYPIMKDLFLFWEDHLKEIPSPDGKGTVLVAPDGFSPEHGPHEDGVSYDQQLAYDLFTNFIEAAEILDVDPKERAKAATMRGRLLGPQIGSWGQLQEWMVDRDRKDDTHRHLSHLIALHPGRQISPLITPELAEAARISLLARGDGSDGGDGDFGWSKAWKISMWARLNDGKSAYRMLREMVSANVFGNLFAECPPFQIDANFGYAAGVSEMLLQSHMGALHILPALPKRWATGSVTGMKARGGFVVGLEWDGEQLTEAVILSEQGNVCRIHSAVALKVTKDGKPVPTKTGPDDTIEFPTDRGAEYRIRVSQ